MVMTPEEIAKELALEAALGGYEPSVAEDMLRATPGGLTKGVVGLTKTPGALTDLAARGATWLYNKGSEAITGENPNYKYTPEPEGYASKLIRKYTDPVIERLTAYEPKTTAGQMTERTMEFTPAAMLMGGPAALPAYAGAPGVASVAAEKYTKDMGRIPERVDFGFGEMDIPLIGGQKVSDVASIAAALTAPMAYNAIKTGLIRAITPYPARRGLPEMARRLEADTGIKATAGQRTGNRELLRREAATGKLEDVYASQLEDFTEAVMKQIDARGYLDRAMKAATASGDEAAMAAINRVLSEPSVRATRDVMEIVRKGIGDGFDRVVPRLNITPDGQMLQRMVGAAQQYAGQVAIRNQAPAVERTLNAIARIMRSGAQIKGKNYHAWRSFFSKTAGTSKDAPLVQLSKEFVNALDDAAARTMQAQGGSASLLDRFNLLRRQWRDFRVIENVMSKAGRDAQIGMVKPQVLRGAIRTQEGQGMASRTGRDLSDLASEGSAVMLEPPTSGTAENLAAMLRRMGGMSGAGAVVGGATGGAPGAGVGAALGFVGPWALDKARMSPTIQRYLGNQVLGGTPSPALLDERFAAVLTALAAREDARRKKEGTSQ